MAMAAVRVGSTPRSMGVVSPHFNEHRQIKDRKVREYCSSKSISLLYYVLLLGKFLRGDHLS